MTKHPAVAPSVFDQELQAPDLRVVPSTPAKEAEAKDVVKMTAYLPNPVYELLREIAFMERVKLNDLVLEGIDHVLKARLHPSVAELKAGKRA